MGDKKISKIRFTPPEGGSGARYSGVMYLSPNDEIMACCMAAAATEAVLVDRAAKGAVAAMEAAIKAAAEEAEAGEGLEPGAALVGEEPVEAVAAAEEVAAAASCSRMVIFVRRGPKVGDGFEFRDASGFPFSSGRIVVGAAVIALRMIMIF